MAASGRLGGSKRSVSSRESSVEFVRHAVSCRVADSVGDMRSPVESPTALEGGLDGATAGAFSYDDAFVRNIGWVTPAEQQILRERRVAVAGLGGVGGSHVLALARLGVGAFHIADFDRFDLANMNRQAGAFMGTMGRPKAEVIAEMVREINPEAEVTVFPEGVAGGASSDAYLAGCDLVLDGLDFFVIDVRRALFAAAAAAGIPAVTAAPLGTGTAWLVFTPEGIGFDRYFDFKDGESTLRQYVKFMIGLSPKGVHRAALVAPERVDFSARAGPSTAMGCQLASAVAVTEALKLLLGRPGLRPAPAFHQFDPVLGRYVSGRQRVRPGAGALCVGAAAGRQLSSPAAAADRAWRTLDQAHCAQG